MGCGSSSSKKPGKPQAANPPPANAFLPHYTLAALGGREVFGPFLLLRSYDPESGALLLSALVVCSESAQARIATGAPSATFWVESRAGAEPPADPAGGASTVVAGELLYSWRNWRFWRFGMRATCGAVAQQLKYQVNLVPENVFSVSLPARKQPWRWAFYSCNGLDDPTKKDVTGGLQPLWSDLMAAHAEQPLHVLVGGGDQLYNDGVFEGPQLQGWDRTLRQGDTAAKASLPFSAAIREEVEEYFFSHYSVHWAQPVYSQALASIPSVNIWDDHDIFDGWGSYPETVQRAAVLQGIFTAAQLFYLLFQQHSRPELLPSDGFWCGTSAMHRFGDSTVVVLPDTRTFRTIKQICPPDFYEELRRRLTALPESVRHVVLVLTVPLVWPKTDISAAVQLLSNTVTQDVLVNALMGSTGLLQKLPMRFGQAEILDDLKDHWEAREHTRERDDLLRMIMSLAEAKGIRFTSISGDVHCAAYGMVHSLGAALQSGVALEGGVPLPSEAARATDPRFIAQIVSSAIVNVPPPAYVLDTIAAAGAIPTPFLEACVARMLPLQRSGAAATSEPELRLLRGERNWCAVSQRDGPDIGGPALVFSLRCESELGTGRMTTFEVEVPPLQGRR